VHLEDDVLGAPMRQIDRRTFTPIGRGRMASRIPSAWECRSTKAGNPPARRKEPTASSEDTASNPI